MTLPKILITLHALAFPALVAGFTVLLSSSSLVGPPAPAEAKGGRAGATGVIFVTGQGLYYDTFVVVDPLPMHGRFQLIENGMTEYGPGDPGYLGGRWWEDTNGNGFQDEDDHFFLCPLLGPGRPMP